jgi:hypothetical protein
MVITENHVKEEEEEGEEVQLAYRLDSRHTFHP